MRHIPLISSILLGLFFFLVGFDKLFHIGEFMRSLDGYVVIPKGVSRYIAYPIIFSELWISVGLFVTPWRKIAGFLAAGMVLAFTVALALNYIYAPEASCGCWFTISSGRINLAHLLQNTVLMGLAIFVAQNSACQLGGNSQIP